MTKQTCEMCGVQFNTESEKPNFDFGGIKWVCQKCIDEFEESQDIQDLYQIISRQGKNWVREKLDELVSIETKL